MKLKNAGLLALGLAVGIAYADQESFDAFGGVRDGLETRRTEMLTLEVRSPFPKPDCPPRLDADSECVLGLLNHALASLFLKRTAAEVATANKEIEMAVARIRPMSKSTARSGPEEESSDTSDSRADKFHWVAALLFRITRLFGTNGNRASGTLNSENEQAIITLFRDWAGIECRLSMAEPQDVWRVWGSENHSAMRDGACWSAAELMRRDQRFADFHYKDGSTPARQASAWSEFLKTYIREHARHGMLLEYFSPTYSKYTLQNIYLYADFSDDAELNRLARAMLDLWWAQWAIEQVDGVHGGSKTRAYPEMIADGAPMGAVAWLYFGFSTARSENLPPALAAPFTSGYQPPEVIVDIALDAEGRGDYEVRARAPGLAAKRKSKSGDLAVSADGGILRVAYVTPDFVMGTSLFERRPLKDWVAGSVQNHWNGIVMARDPKARIVAVPSAREGKSYNAIWGVQSKAVQILQALPPPLSKRAGPIRVWFGAPLKRVERDGWVFVDNAAYVAVRPAVGSYRWDASEPNWMLPTDGTSPIIVQGARKRDYKDLAEFQKAVLNSPLTVRDGVLEYTGLKDAGRFSFPVKSGEPPKINDRSIDLAPPYGIKSPFINSALGASTVTISKASKRIELDFGVH